MENTIDTLTDMIPEDLRDHKAFVAVTTLLGTRPFSEELARKATDALVEAPVDEVKAVFRALAATYPQKREIVVGLAAIVGQLRLMKDLSE